MPPPIFFFFCVSVVARWVENDLRDLKTRSEAPVCESV